MAKRKAIYNREADLKWIESNREHRTYLNTRSTARGFIRNRARLEDIAELKELIEERERQLKMKLEIFETHEGKSKDYCDIEVIADGQKMTILDVPFYDKKGQEISYDEALELYGFDGLAQDIWDDEDYLAHLKNNFKNFETKEQ